MSTVSFLEDKFEIAVRNKINKPEGKITLDDLQLINGIVITEDGSDCIPVPWQNDGDAMNMKFPDFFFYSVGTDPEKLASDLKYFSHIKTLHIYTPMKNLSFIREFTSLNELYIAGCETDDWGFLEGLINLKYLSIFGCNISDLKPIGELCKKQEEIYQVARQKVDGGEEEVLLMFSIPCLTNLVLYKCQISNIEPLAEGKHLSDLNLSHNRITDLNPMAKLDQLYYLTLRWNEIQDISPLSDLKQLYYLNLRHNRIKDIRIFKEYNKNMGRLFLKHNEITDYDSIKHLHLVVSDAKKYTRKYY